MIGGILRHKSVNFTSGHAFADFGSQHVENTRIDDSSASNAFNLFGRFHQPIGGDDKALLLHFQDAAIKGSGRCSGGNHPIMLMMSDHIKVLY